MWVVNQEIFSLTGENWPVSLYRSLTDGLCQTGVGAMKYWENWRFTLVLNLSFQLTVYRATRPKAHQSFIFKQLGLEQ